MLWVFSIACKDFQSSKKRAKAEVVKFSKMLSQIYELYLGLEKLKLYHRVFSINWCQYRWSSIFEIASIYDISKFQTIGSLTSILTWIYTDLYNFMLYVQLCMNIKHYDKYAQPFTQFSETFSKEIRNLLGVSMNLLPFFLSFCENILIENFSSVTLYF